MENEVDVIEWLKTVSDMDGKFIKHMPAYVYKHWYTTYVGKKRDDPHSEFQMLLSEGAFLDDTMFSRQSCKVLSCMLVASLNTCYMGKGIKKIME